MPAKCIKINTNMLCNNGVNYDILIQDKELFNHRFSYFNLSLMREQKFCSNVVFRLLINDLEFCNVKLDQNSTASLFPNNDVPLYRIDKTILIVLSNSSITPETVDLYELKIEYRTLDFDPSDTYPLIIDWPFQGVNNSLKFMLGFCDFKLIPIFDATPKLVLEEDSSSVLQLYRMNTENTDIYNTRQNITSLNFDTKKQKLILERVTIPWKIKDKQLIAPLIAPIDLVSNICIQLPPRSHVLNVNFSFNHNQSLAVPYEINDNLLCIGCSHLDNYILTLHRLQCEIVVELQSAPTETGNFYYDRCTADLELRSVISKKLADHSVSIVHPNNLLLRHTLSTKLKHIDYRYGNIKIGDTPIPCKAI